MQKKYKPKWYHWIPFILAWVLLLPFALLAVPYMWYVSRPIQRAIDEQPQYWQNWKQIKLKSRRSTMQVLSMLLGECSHRGELDCQFRSEEDIVRLEKFLSRKRPHTSKPRSIDDVIFFEYRRRWGGGGHKLRNSVFPVWVPMPAYAKAWLPSRAFFMIKSCVYWIYKIYFGLWSDFFFVFVEL